MSEADPNMLRIEVPRRLAGERFDRALAALVPDQTKAQLQKLVRRGHVKLDGRKVVRSNFKLRGGESLLVHLSDPRGRPAPLEPDWIFEDEEILVVAKPPGMVVHPVDEGVGDTLAELAVQRYGPLPSVVDANRPGIVHRLDRETSGVLVLARTPRALEHLRRQFAEREVEKRYLAIVHGTPDRDEFEVDAPLSPVPGDKDRQRIDPRGRSALTRVRVLQRAPDFSLVECRPRTGRRHQLRVHLCSVGHPVAADKLYRPEPGIDRARGLAHHGLHAAELSFRHPRTEQPARFEAQAPPSFRRFWQESGGSSH